MKYGGIDGAHVRHVVAPHWGAWIEMPIIVSLINWLSVVAPHWGAWIEITASDRNVAVPSVAPHWGAWIEIVSNPPTA